MVLIGTSNHKAPWNGDSIMATETPGYASRHAALTALSSRYVQVDELQWHATRFPGIQIKVLMEDTATGSRHSASAPEGALVLGFFLKPNHFF